MKTETAQRILWFALIFIVLMVIVTAFAAIGYTIAAAYIDIGSFITDPTVLAFLQDYPYAPTLLLWVLVGIEVIYLAIIYLWRQNPGAHRTGFTILGILQLLVGWSLPGLLILLPGLLMEESQ